MRKILLIATLIAIPTSLYAGIFSWTDSSGNIVYGDSPPENVAAKSVEPPKLTILENFANRYEDPNKRIKSPAKVQVKQSHSSQAQHGVGQEVTQPYDVLKILAPKANQSIRANDGDVTVMVSTSPKLRAGDKVVVVLNGSQVAVSNSRVANLKGLDRGEYELSLSIQNASGNQLISSETISFNVVKNSVLTNKNKPYNPYETDPNQ